MLSNENFGLQGLWFVNAASLPYAKVDVDGNTLFSGRNGAGKTTILRAVLYFYGAFRSEQLGISRSKKKRFEEYYFTATNSYLIYNFSNRYGRVLAFVYKSGGVRLKYRLAKVPDRFDLEDFEALLFENNIAKEPKELFNAMVGKDFELSPVLHSPKEYKNVLYGQERMLITYSFFEANSSYEQIAKTISNIFINSKLDSGSIKRSLASSVSGFEPIDLEQMQKMLEGFSLQYDDIKSFEKHQPTIEEAVDTLALLEDQKAQINSKVLQLHANVAASQAHMDEVLQSIERLELAKGEHHQAFALKKERYEQEKDALNSEIAILENKIVESDKLEKSYQSQGIQALLKAHAMKPELLSRLEGIAQEKALLTQEFESVTARFDAMQESAKAQFVRFEQERMAEQTHREREFTQNLQTALQKRSDAMEHFNQELNSEREALQEDFQARRSALEALRFEKERIGHQSFVGERLEALQNGVAQTQTAVSRADEKQNLDKKELELLIEKRHAKEQESAYAQERVREKYMQVRLPLEQRQKALQSQLEQLQGSVAEFLDQSDLAYKALLQTVLKEELLFANHLNPMRTEGSSLLGLELDWSAIQVEPVTLESLKVSLEAIEKELLGLKSAYEKEQESVKKSSENAVRALLRNEALLREQVQNNDLNYQRCEREALEAKEQLIALEKEQETLRSQASLAIDRRQKEAETALMEAEQKLETFKADREKSRQLLLHQYHEKEQTLRTEFALYQQEQATLIQSEKEAMELKLSSIEKERNAALDAQGVDSRLLEKLEDTEQKLSFELESIESKRELVETYKLDKKRVFDLQESRKEELLVLKKSADTLSGDFIKVKQEYETVLSQYKAEEHQWRKRKQQLKEDLEAYERFKSSQSSMEFDLHIAQSIEANDERLADLTFGLLELMNAQKESLRKLQNRLQKVFDALSKNSAFNLEKPARDDDVSMIMSAKALQEFLVEDKLQTFKDEVAQLFTTTLHHIASETTALLKAESEIKKVVSKINKTLDDLQGIKVIEEIRLRADTSDDRLLQALKSIETLALDISPYGEDSLFSGAHKQSYKSVLKALDTLNSELASDKRDHLSVEDTFVLEFRAIENGHDTQWVASLDGIGSNGTDVMVKAMVYIAMLSLARRQSSKSEAEVFFHCILDEVGILAPNYLKELIAYANAKQIRFINGAPDEKLVTTYKSLYMLSTNAQHKTQVRRLLSQV